MSVLQNNNFAYHVQERKRLQYLCIIQQPVSALAGSRRIGLKTARPGIDYSSH